MGALSMLVPKHPLSAMLLDLMGLRGATDTWLDQVRFEYIWYKSINKKIEIKLLIRNGPTSWVEPSKNAYYLQEVENHPGFLRFEECSRDTSYVVAIFEPSNFPHSLVSKVDEEDYMATVSAAVEKIDDISEIVLAEEGEPYIRLDKDPFDIFDEQMANFGKNTKNKGFERRAAALAKALSGLIDEVKKTHNEDKEFDEFLSASGVSKAKDDDESDEPKTQGFMVAFNPETGETIILKTEQDIRDFAEKHGLDANKIINKEGLSVEIGGPDDNIKDIIGNLKNHHDKIMSGEIDIDGSSNNGVPLNEDTLDELEAMFNRFEDDDDDLDDDDDDY